MDFELSDDQLALRDAAAALLDSLAAPEHVRAAAASDDGFDRTLWKAMVDQGWMGVELPEDAGGLGLGAVQAAVLLEQVGRHTAPAPFSSSLLALGALRGAGVDEWTDGLLAGETIGCVAWSRAPDAVVADGGPTLTGRADPVPFAPVADVAIVVGREAAGGGGALFAVDLAEVGRPRAEPAMDLTRPIGWLDLDAAPARRLGGADTVDAL